MHPYVPDHGKAHFNMPRPPAVMETNDMMATVPAHEDGTADSAYFRKPAKVMPEKHPAHMSRMAT